MLKVNDGVAKLFVGIDVVCKCRASKRHPVLCLEALYHCDAALVDLEKEQKIIHC